MQVDREVRAREGDVRMRYNPAYLKHEKPQQFIGIAPGPITPMAYVSPEEHVESGPRVQASSPCPGTPHKSSTFPDSPNKLQKTPKVERKTKDCRMYTWQAPKQRHVSLNVKSMPDKDLATLSTPIIRVSQYESDIPQPAKKSSVQIQESTEAIMGQEAAQVDENVLVKQYVVPEQTVKTSWGRKIMLLGRWKLNMLESIPENSEKGERGDRRQGPNELGRSSPPQRSGSQDEDSSSHDRPAPIERIGSQDENAKPAAREHRRLFSKPFGKQDNVSAAIPRSGEASLSQEHTLPNCTVDEFQLEVESLTSKETHRLMSCTVTQDQDEVESQDDAASQITQHSHRLMSCPVVEVPETVPEEAGPIGHQLMSCAVVEVPTTLAKQAEPVGQRLMSCTVVKETAPSETTFARSPEHTIVECVSTEEDLNEPSQPTYSSEHIIDDCETVIVKYVKPVGIPQHHLDDCDTVPSSEVDVSAQELSYVHDFTDCPVDKAVLEFVERGRDGRKTTQEHDLVDCRKPSSLADLPSKLLDFQHALIDCSEDNPVLISQEGRRSISVGLFRNNSKLLGLREHRLVSCPTPAVLSPLVAQHDVTTASEDCEATQQPLNHGTQRAENTGDSSRGTESASTEPNSSPNSTEDAPKPDGDERVRRKQRRRRRRASKKPANSRKPSLQAETNQFDRQFRNSLDRTSAQLALSQLLAANNSSPKGSNLAGQTDGEMADREFDTSAAATRGEGSEISAAVRSVDDPRSPSGKQVRVRGLWQKFGVYWEGC